MRGVRFEALGLTTLVAAAGAIRFAAWQRTAVMFNDGPRFLDISQLMANADWRAALAEHYHPLYPLATLVARDATGSWESAAVAVSIVAGACSVGFLYRLLRDLCGSTAGWVGALLLAVHPRAVEFSCDVQSDGLYLALFLGGLALAQRALVRGGVAVAGWAGAFAGLAYLTRPEGLGVALAAGLLAALKWLRREWSWWEVARFGLALALGTLVFATPYLVAMRVEHGSWVLTRKKSMGLGLPVGAPVAAPVSEPLQAPPPDLERYRQPAVFQVRQGRWGAAAAELTDTWASSLRTEYLILVALGLWVRRGRPGRYGEFCLVLLVVYLPVLLWLTYSSGYVSRRHTLPPSVPLLGYAALAVPALGTALAGGARRWRRSGRSPSPRLVSGVLLAVLMALGLAHALTEHRADGLAERRAAEWLAARAPERAAVAAFRRRIAYYASAPFVPLDRVRREHLVPYLHETGARYVIVDESDLDRHPGFEDVLVTRLERLHRELAAGRAAAIFEVPGPAGGPPRE